MRRQRYSQFFDSVFQISRARSNHASVKELIQIEISSARKNPAMPRGVQKADVIRREVLNNNDLFAEGLYKSICFTGGL